MNEWIVGKDLMKLHFHIKKRFYSKLYLEDITDDKDYIHAQKVFQEFKLKVQMNIMIYMFKVIHYCLQMYLKILEINLLKYMNLILLIVYLHLGQHGNHV